MTIPVPDSWRDSTFAECDFRDIIPQGSETILGLTPDQCAFNVLRDRRYKYVHLTGLPPLFFDLEADPHEFCDLAGDPNGSNLSLGPWRYSVTYCFDSKVMGLKCLS